MVICSCDECNYQTSVVHWYDQKFINCDNIITNHNYSEDDECYSRPKFICNKARVRCGGCSNVSVVYHNHWCAVMFQQWSKMIDNKNHDPESNEYYYEDCFHA